MPSPTSLEVLLSDTEYSRYEVGRDTVIATIVAVGTDFTAESIRVDLVKARRSRDAIIATATITVDGLSPQTDDVSFYLPDIVDQDFLNMARHGKYFVRATSLTDETIIGESPDFSISIMTVDKFKENFLFGLKLNSTQVFSVKYQPKAITGVEVIEVSSGSTLGFGTLTYTYTPDPVTRKMSWRGGPQVLITAPGNYTLRAGNTLPGGCSSNSSSGGDYIVVKIRSLALLPTTTIMEDLLIEGKTIDDSTLADYIERTVSWLETEILWTWLEPTNAVTESDATSIQFASNSAFPTALFLDSDYDVITPTLTYFSPRRGSWIAVQFPFGQLLRVDMMYGAMGGVRVLDIDLSWIQFASPGSSFVQLVPYNNIIGFTFVGNIWNSTLSNSAELPSFWRYNVWAGLREVTPDLMEFIGKKAAIDALTMLGLALRPGIGSVSLSRDGVSQSTSYITGQYGPYSGPIMAYKDWLKEEMPRYRAKYRGTPYTVV